MKRTRRIALGLATAVVALVAMSGSAYAKGTKEPMFFGEFTASIAGQEISEMHPATVTDKEGLAEFSVGPFKWSCEKVKSKGQMTAERSTTFNTEVKFAGCTGSRLLAGGFEEKGLRFKIGGPVGMEFRANGSGQIGEESGELKIVKESKLKVTTKGGVCEILIPDQSMPVKSENKPEKEYETVEYFPEEEPTTKVKKYPSGIKERLEIDWSTKAFLYDIPAGKEKQCGTTKENSEEVVQMKGHFEGELDELNIKGGEFGFTTEKEV